MSIAFLYFFTYPAIMKQYTSSAYKHVKWRSSGGGRVYEMLHGRKHFLGRLYDATFHAPIYGQLKKERRYVQHFLGGNNLTVVDLGGNIGSIQDKKLQILLQHHKYLRVDIDPEAKPDIVADAAKLPLKSNSVHFIILKSLLEHVTEPWSVINEAHRVLKKGGALYFFVPFFNRIHAAPHDYYRFTNEGMRYLLRNFSNVDVIPVGGFFSSLINQLYLVTYFMDGILLLGMLLRVVFWPFAKLLSELDAFDRFKLTPTFYYGIAIK